MSTTAAIRAVVALVALTIMAIVALAIFKEGDNTATILQIVGIVAPTTVALLAYLQSSKNNEVIAKVDTKVDQNTAVTNETKIVVDGRMTQLIDTVTQLAESQKSLVAERAMAAGITEGRQQVATTIAAERDAVANATPTATSTTIAGPTTITPMGDTRIVMPDGQVE